MALGEKIRASKTLDDFVAAITSEQRSMDPAEALEGYETYNKPEVKNHLFNNLVAPAVDEFYETLKLKLDDQFGSDEAKVHGKKTEMQKSINESLEAFFTKYMPDVLTGLDDITDVEERHDRLTSLYDNLVLGADQSGRAGEGVQTLSGYVDLVTRKKDLTVGHIKREFYSQRAQHVGAIMRGFDSKAAEHFTGHLPGYKLAQHLLPQIKKDYEVPEPMTLSRLPKEMLGDLYSRIKKGTLGEVASQYGFEAKQQEPAPAGTH